MESNSRNPGQNGERETQALWDNYFKEKSQATKEKLLIRYAYLVRHVIGRMKISLISTLDSDDLESAGTIGLIKALENFDPTRGVKFETYAYRRIQGGVLDYVRQLDYLSRSSRERVTQFKRSCAALKEKFGRPPTDKEIMKALKIDEKKLNHLYFELSCEEPIPLETFIPDGSGPDEQGEDVVKDENDVGALNELLKQETLDILKKVIDQLPEKERLLISLYYYEDLTFKEIGEILSVSESRVCQLHGKALLDLQVAFEKLAR